MSGSLKVNARAGDSRRSLREQLEPVQALKRSSDVWPTPTAADREKLRREREARARR
jgi:hypothetical protein